MLTVGDRTGELPVYFWGGHDKEQVDSIFDSLKVGDILRITGKVSRYKGDLRISVNPEQYEGIKKASKDDFDPSDFIPTSKRDTDEMFKNLIEYVETIDDSNLSELVMSFLDDEEFVDAFKRSPYSKGYSYSYLGGLLEHTLDDVEMADAVSRTYPELDRNLLLAAAVVHDFGKVHEYVYEAAIDHTTDAMMIGHTVLCERIIRDRIEEIPGFPEETARKLYHIILSHHGDYEWGSARSPRLEEAVALHHIDLLNVRMRGFLQAKEELGEDDEEMVYVTRKGIERPIFTR